MASNLGGRPPIFDTPEQAEAKVEEYFQYVKGEFKEIEAEWEDKEGNKHKSKEIETIREPEPVTITGLALFLGFSSRQGLYDYGDKEGFSCIRKARLRVEQAYERNLHGNSVTGSIFALKNMGWIDKQDIDQKTELSGSVGFSGIQVIQPDAPTNTEIPS